MPRLSIIEKSKAQGHNPPNVLPVGVSSNGPESATRFGSYERDLVSILYMNNHNLHSRREQKKSLAKRKWGEKLTTQQTQSSLNRVSRFPQGKQAREPQIELKDGTHLPALVLLTPHIPDSHPDNPVPDGNAGTPQNNLESTAV